MQRTSAALRQSCEHLACLAQHQREAVLRKNPLKKTREVYPPTWRIISFSKWLAMEMNHFLGIYQVKHVISMANLEDYPD